MLYVVVDESTDRNGNQVCNLLVGELSEEQACSAHLICSKTLEITNADTVMAFVDENLCKIIFIVLNLKL